MRKLREAVPIATNLRADAYDSTVTFALPFVTFTPSALARAMMSIRFRDETACAILEGE